MGSYADGETRVSDEASQEILTSAQPLELPLHGPAELMRIRGGKVGETCELGVIPYAFIRVQLRSICRKAMRSDMYIAGQVLSYAPGIVVNVAPVPNDFEGPLDLATKVSQELDDVLSSHVSVRLKEAEVKAESVPLGAQRDGADGGDPIVAIPALLDGRLTSRSKGSPDQGGEHEA
jgi:hypothetical protein